MITEIDKKTIYKISKKYRAKRVLLFGSSLKPEIESRDIDIAVEGILPKDFFSNIYATIYKELKIFTR